MRRRDFLRAAGALPAMTVGCFRKTGCQGNPPPRTDGVLVNDIHSELNETRVQRVATERTLEGIRALLRNAVRESRAVSIGGGRHAMGGQQFGTDTIHLDTRAFSRVLGFDAKRGLVEIEAGIQWPDLIDWQVRRQEGRDPQWGIIQKQTGADRLCIGGALAANAHGRGLTLKPLVGDVESFRIVTADGEVRTCSRVENRELFGLAIGGYGLFGVLYSVTLRLKRRRKVRRIVEVRGTDGLMDAFEESIARGGTYGSVHLDTNERSPTFLTRGILACYEPVDPDASVSASPAKSSAEDWIELLYLEHTDKAKAFHPGNLGSKNDRIYWDDLQQIGYYVDGYHHRLDERIGARVHGSDMVTEVYVPRPQLHDFLREAAELLPARRASVIYGSIRLIEKDDETFLPWAKDRYACIVMSLHVDHTARGIELAADAFRELIERASARGGSFFLTYHRWATREQVLACYPRMPEFLRLKQKYDPGGLFESEWYRHHRKLLA